MFGVSAVPVAEAKCVQRRQGLKIHDRRKQGLELHGGRNWGLELHDRRKRGLEPNVYTALEPNRFTAHGGRGGARKTERGVGISRRAEAGGRGWKDEANLFTARREVRSILPFYLTSSKIVKDSATLMITLSIYDCLMSMISGCDAFIILPGGYGTLMTIFTLATWAEMKFHTKPIGLLNFNNFFHHLLGFLDEGVYQTFISPFQREIFKSANTSSELIQKLQNNISTVQDSVKTPGFKRKRAFDPLDLSL
ncbi:cytokinin riboside 5'-monophosphatephosphoribohydrolase LOG [Striga asiatica]|uniref:cytokinin riboside 5'-monophosphate phosphoribohydrolase n=1 Tax=Striga asiatica TaxID=4170 RepID=A0A5A7RIT6_STRAF|nr:cytokinin riboside 5'-monophosphatephosphoribohydrolase LOG [Striga asiatica]